MAATKQKIAQVAAELVAKLGASEVARVVGSSEPAARAWAAGTRTPSGTAAKALRTLHAARSAPAKAKGAAVPAPRVDVNATALDGVRTQVAELRAELKAAKAAGAGLRDVASLHGALTSALRLQSRLGSEYTITVAQIRKSAAWKQLEGVLSAVVFDPHPGICEEFLRALEKLEPGRSST